MVRKKKNQKKFLYWTPRILGIIFIIFISIFALDVFGENYKPLQLIIALFMHLIPSIIITIFLIISWKHEKIGGYIFITLGIIFGFFFEAFFHIASFVVLVIPLWIIGILFFLNSRNKK
ncbi:MAG: hypothetical protein ABIF88_04115 [archaeon]